MNDSRVIRCRLIFSGKNDELTPDFDTGFPGFLGAGFLGGQVYRVLNRSVGKMHLFGKDADFEAFQRVMIEAHQRHPIRILCYCVLSNHWHFAVWPDADGQVTAFFRWLAHTHAMRWRVAHRTVGYGHLYQGRFQSFPVQSDEHLLSVLRYIERCRKRGHH